MKILRAASLGSNFTGSYKKRVLGQKFGSSLASTSNNSSFLPVIIPLRFHFHDYEEIATCSWGRGKL